MADDDGTVKLNIRDKYGVSVVHHPGMINLHMSAPKDLNLDTFTSRGFERVSKSKKEEAKALLDSLAFPSMFSRIGRIEDAPPIPETFSWVLETDAERRLRRMKAKGRVESRCWENFPDWLARSTSENIYWISSKAGSGKSSLMYFLVSHGKTRVHLLSWTGGQPPIIPHFFFWRSTGDKLQRSIEGLFRSLLYQICLQLPQALSFLAAEHAEAKWSTGLWTTNRCMHYIKDFLSTFPSTSFAFFIDGLDEFVGDTMRLLTLLEEIASFANAKLCVSS